jgi:hypothetical protein
MVSWKATLVVLAVTALATLVNTSKTMAEEQAVIVHIPLTDVPFGSERERQVLSALGDELDRVIKNKSVGEFDGDEYGGGECRLYMYGPDADALFAIVQPVLLSASITKGGFAIKRYGKGQDAKAKEVVVSLGG